MKEPQEVINRRVRAWYHRNQEREKQRIYEYRSKHYEEYQEYQKKYMKVYRKTERYKESDRKHKAKYRRNKGYIQLMSNPFPEEILVEYHHVDNIFTIPLPRLTHRISLGKNHHDKCDKWINKLYCLDIKEITKR